MATLPVSYTTVAVIYEIATPKIGSITALTSAHIADIAGTAEAEINGILARQYSLPFSCDLPLLTAISTNLSAYYVIRRTFTQEQKDTSDWVEKFREDASNLMEKLADGKLELVTGSGTVIGRDGTINKAWSNTMGYNPTFFEGDQSQMNVDPNKLDDAETDRDI